MSTMSELISIDGVCHTYTPAHGREVLAAGDDRDLGVSLRGQLRRHQPADRAGAEDADSHAVTPSFSASPMRISLPVAPFGISARNTIFRGTL